MLTEETIRNVAACLGLSAGRRVNLATDSSGLPDVTGRLLLTAREVAAALAISERTLWTLTNTGAIRSIKIGRAVRYVLLDLQDYIARLRDSQAAQTGVQASNQIAPPARLQSGRP
jgi:excisionase family DNA binding protein